jgi:hypothetical protein
MASTTLTEAESTALSASARPRTAGAIFWRRAMSFVRAGVEPGQPFLDAAPGEPQRLQR